MPATASAAGLGHVQPVLRTALYRVAPVLPMPVSDVMPARILFASPLFNCRTRQIASALPLNADPDPDHAC